MRALRAYVLMCLACPRGNVPCVLTCSYASVSCVITCSRVSVPCMLMCSHGNVSCVLTYSSANAFGMLMCSRVEMPCVLFSPTCLRAITTNNKNKFSVTWFPYIFGAWNKTVVHSSIFLTRRKPLTGAMTNVVQ